VFLPNVKQNALSLPPVRDNSAKKNGLEKLLTALFIIRKTLKIDTEKLKYFMK